MLSDAERVRAWSLTVGVFVSLADSSCVIGVLEKLRDPVLLSEVVKEVELKRRDRDTVWC